MDIWGSIKSLDSDKQYRGQIGPLIVWLRYLKLRQTIMQDIKEQFDAEGIEIPFPHRTLYAGSVTEPFPIQLISKNDNLQNGE